MKIEDMTDRQGKWLLQQAGSYAQKFYSPCPGYYDREDLQQDSVLYTLQYMEAFDESKYPPTRTHLRRWWFKRIRWAVLGKLYKLRHSSVQAEHFSQLNGFEKHQNPIESLQDPKAKEPGDKENFNDLLNKLASTREHKLILKLKTEGYYDREIATILGDGPNRALIQLMRIRRRARKHFQRNPRSGALEEKPKD